MKTWRAVVGLLRGARWSFGLAAVLLISAEAHAHPVGLSRGQYARTPDGLSAELSFARRDLPAVAVDTRKAEDVANRILVSTPAGACSVESADARLAEEDGLSLTARFRCPKPEGPITVEFAVLDELPAGHRHIARFDANGVQSEEVLHRGARAFTLAGTAPTDTAPASLGPLGFFRLGVEHILTGFDHLVFLLGLVLVASRLRSLVATVTAFTLAHSIALALAVTGVFTPSPRWVEPAIALSIFYVGVENFFIVDGARRFRITFPFGLIHGFGFAGALLEIGLPRTRLPLALGLFNAGVEAGQLAVLALLLPLLMLARRNECFRRRGYRVLSGGVVVLGVVWFVLRVGSAACAG